MKTYKITQAVTLQRGTVRLAKEQAKGRDHKLKAVKAKDCYEITEPNQFKAGQVIGYDGDIPKNMAEGMGEVYNKNLSKEDAAAAKKAEAEAAKQEEQRKALEAKAKADWDSNENLRAEHANDFGAYCAKVLEQVG